MLILSIVLQSLLLAYYVFSGSAKVIGAKYWSDIFAHLGLTQKFRAITGYVQLIGAALLAVGFWYDWAISLAALWLGTTMLIACFVHLKVRDSLGKTMPALVFAALNTVVFTININGLTNIL